jgi:Flp pilus assembly protein TadG
VEEPFDLDETTARRGRRMSKGVVCFLREEDGAIETISALIWMPVILSFFMFFADVSYVLYSRSQLIRVAEDSTRMRSLGVYETDLEVVHAIANRISAGDTLPPTITSNISLGVVRTQLQVNVSSIDMLGIVSRLTSDARITINVSQFKENPEV